MHEDGGAHAKACMRSGVGTAIASRASRRVPPIRRPSATVETQPLASANCVRIRLDVSGWLVLQVDASEAGLEHAPQIDSQMSPCWHRREQSWTKSLQAASRASKRPNASQNAHGELLLHSTPED